MSRKIHVTVILGAFLPVPAIQGGAVERLWFDISEALAKQNIDMTLISKKHPDLFNREIVENVKYIRILGFNSVNFMPLRLMLDFIYSFFAVRKSSNADIIITNSFWSPLFAKLLTHSKVWVSVHRFPRHQMWLYKHVDLIQAVSSAVANGIIEQSPSVKDKVTVIPNFVAKPNINVHLANKEKIILFVGRLHPEKGVENLLLSFSSIPAEQRKNWKLVIVGPHESKFGGGGNRYMNKLSKIGASDVVFTGKVFDKDKLNEYYKSAALFVYPTTANNGEAFPLAPLEAMSFGCIPIVLNLACFDEYIHEGINGRVVNSENICVNLKNIIIEQINVFGSQKHNYLAEKAMVTASKFSIRNVTSLILKFLEELS